MNTDEIADAWIRYQTKEKHKDDDSDFVAVELLATILFSSRPNDHEKIYEVISKITEKTDDKAILASLGAGPIEDLLCQHGETFVDRILDNARKDPRWRFALGYVWIDGSKSKDVQKRVREAIQLYFPNGTP